MISQQTSTTRKGHGRELCPNCPSRNPAGLGNVCADTKDLRLKPLLGVVPRGKLLNYVLDPLDLIARLICLLNFDQDNQGIVIEPMILSSRHVLKL